MLFISTAIMFGVLLHSVFLFSSYYYFTFVIIACAYMGMGHFLHTFISTAVARSHTHVVCLPVANGIHLCTHNSETAIDDVNLIDDIGTDLMRSDKRIVTRRWNNE